MMAFSVVIIEPSPALAADRARCNSGFRAGQIRENVLLQLPFLAISGDVIIQEPGSSNVSDVFRILNNFADTGGGTGLGNLAILYIDSQSCAATTNASGVASCSVVLNQTAGNYHCRLPRSRSAPGCSHHPRDRRRDT